MTLSTPVDTLKYLTTYLYNHASWSSAIHIHAGELPPGYTLVKSVLILPEGGPSSDDLPISYERFTFHTYGSTPYEAREVSDLIYKILIREKGSVTISGLKVYIMYSHRVFGPTFIREPDTEWPRWSSSYDLHILDYAVT